MRSFLFFSLPLPKLAGLLAAYWAPEGDEAMSIRAWRRNSSEYQQVPNKEQAQIDSRRRRGSCAQQVAFPALESVLEYPSGKNSAKTNLVKTNLVFGPEETRQRREDLKTGKPIHGANAGSWFTNLWITWDGRYLRVEPLTYCYISLYTCNLLSIIS